MDEAINRERRLCGMGRCLTRTTEHDTVSAFRTAGAIAHEESSPSSDINQREASRRCQTPRHTHLRRRAWLRPRSCAKMPAGHWLPLDKRRGLREVVSSASRSRLIDTTRQDTWSTVRMFLVVDGLLEPFAKFADCGRVPTVVPGEQDIGPEIDFAKNAILAVDPHQSSGLDIIAK